MKKSIKDFYEFLNVLIGGNQLTKLHRMAIEDYMEKHFKEKDDAEMHDKLGESRSSGSGKFPNGNFSRPCFRER